MKRKSKKRAFVVITNQINSAWLETIRQAVMSLGYIKAVSAEDAETIVSQPDCEMVIIDSAISQDIISLISDIHGAHPSMPIVIATLTRGWRRAREAWRAGAKDYILKSLTNDELEVTIKRLLGHTAPVEPLSINQTMHFTPKATILLADNNYDFLDVRKEFLEQAGYSVISAVNPAEAKRKLEIGGIDLAILDIRLENDDDDRDTSGLRLAKHIARNVPKIILTNFPAFEYVRETLRPQLDGLPTAVDFLAKTEGAIALLATVEDVLRTVAIKNQKIRHSPKVFIAHGHDTEALNQVKNSLQKFGLKPIILFEEADRGDTIIEKLERCCQEADFAIVLFTADDFGYSKDNPIEVKYRARQNVIFELGYLAARLGRRRVRVLYQHGVEIPTDFMGVLYIEMDKFEHWMSNLSRELGDAGIIGKTGR